jgi:hypothetical protein
MEDYSFEIRFVQSIIEYKAGFNLDFCRLLNVRGNDQGTWEVEYGDTDGVSKRYKECETSEEAARLFVEWRHELELGIDIEERLCREQGLIE